MQILRYFAFSLFFSVLMTASCYVPVSPDIFGVHVSCHFNPGYDDHMWIFQVWVDHPIAPDEVREVTRKAVADAQYGYFVGSSSELHNQIPLENILAMMCCIKLSTF